MRNHQRMTAGDIYKINRMIVINDTLSGWDLNWRSGIRGSQASYKNWSSGGVDAVSGTASTLFEAFYRNDQFGYALGVNLKYGRAYLGQQGGRKTDDYIAVNNKFSHHLNMGIGMHFLILILILNLAEDMTTMFRTVLGEN